MKKPKKVSNLIFIFYCFVYDHKYSDFNSKSIKKQKKQKLRKWSRRKASDGMDKDIIVLFVEISKASENSYEITSGTS